MNNYRFDICFIGNAIVDILSKITYEKLDKLEISKGSMQLINEELADKILNNIKNPSFYALIILTNFNNINLHKK